MSLHPGFPSSPYAPPLPDQRWIPADQEYFLPKSVTSDDLDCSLLVSKGEDVYEVFNSGWIVFDMRQIAIPNPR